MLRLALRLLSIARFAGAMEAAKAEAAARMREAAKTAAIFGIATILVIIGGIFVATAAVLGLATVWPMHWAALTVGGMLIFIAGLVLLATRPPADQRTPRQPPPRQEQEPAEPPVDWTEMIRPLETWARQHPGKAALGAVAVGVVLGLLSGQKSDDDD